VAAVSQCTSPKEAVQATVDPSLFMSPKEEVAVTAAKSSLYTSQKEAVSAATDSQPVEKQFRLISVDFFIQICDFLSILNYFCQLFVQNCDFYIFSSRWLWLSLLYKLGSVKI
jgi:hypothetical protein